MGRQRTGDGRVGIGYTEDTCIGRAYDQQTESEFGLPEGYDDPTDYHGKTAPAEVTIGLAGR